MTEEKNKLKTKFSFWYHIYDTSGTANQNKHEYQEEVKKIADFQTVEDFWKIFKYLKSPDELKNGIELQIFKEGIVPAWEDEKNGGRISIRLKKDNSNKIWEEIILDLIGGTLPDNVEKEINGVVISIRKDYNFIQIWFNHYQTSTIAEIE